MAARAFMEVANALGVFVSDTRATSALIDSVWFGLDAMLAGFQLEGIRQRAQTWIEMFTAASGAAAAHAEALAVAQELWDRAHIRWIELQQQRHTLTTRQAGLANRVDPAAIAEADQLVAEEVHLGEEEARIIAQAEQAIADANTAAAKAVGAYNSGRPELPAACAAYENKGPAIWPFSTIRLEGELRRTICVEANRFGISEVLLASLLRHEGYNRSKWIQGRFDKVIEQSRLGQDTVGVAQMRPDLAQRLAKDHFGDDISEDEARDKLVHDKTFATRMAAARLHELVSKHDLSDRQAFIAYAFRDEDLPELHRTNFAGDDGRPRGEDYDDVSKKIRERDDY